MAVNSVNGANYNYNNYALNKAKGVDESTSGANYNYNDYALNKAKGVDESTAVKETENTAATAAGASETSKAKTDTFEKSTQYTPDMDKVNAMKSDLKNNMSAFRNMVQGLFQKQAGIAGNASGSWLNIDKATQLSAQEAISEDGEWGVEKTANRILEFAKALTGGDPSKIDAMKNAVEDGFKAAEKVWGGKMPEITQKTYDKVMEGFDQWAAEGSGVSTAAASEAAAVNAAK